jgi:hypothetical protein
MMGRLTRAAWGGYPDGGARDGVVDCVCVDFMYTVVVCVPICGLYTQDGFYVQSGSPWGNIIHPARGKVERYFAIHRHPTRTTCRSGGEVEGTKERRNE